MGSVLATFVPQWSAAQFYQYNGAGRQQFAHDALEAVSPIYNALPTLSPSEEQWVKKELQAAMEARSSERIHNLTQTREYSIQTAHKYLDVAYFALVQITGKHFTSKQQEVFLWTIAAANSWRKRLIFLFG